MKIFEELHSENKVLSVNYLESLEIDIIMIRSIAAFEDFYVIYQIGP